MVAAFMTTSVQIWHYGLVARWWSEFMIGGEDVDYFCQAVAQSGAPVLDAGCGTGRLLLPFLRMGLDAEGSDASAEMLDWCQKAAHAEGLQTRLHAQAMHELELARRYQTILVCGAFGLGASREDDLEGLVRIRRHLEPGGTLILDHYPPKGTAKTKASAARRKQFFEHEWPEKGDRRRAGDGSELDLRVRLRDFDSKRRAATRETSIRHFVDGREVAEETHSIIINLYSKEEIETALDIAGFRNLRVTGELLSRPALPTDDRIVFYATA
jgi:SAM-dependent methyltransferase